MANDAVLLNHGEAPFVEYEGDAGEVDVWPGHVLELDGAGDYIKSSDEAGVGRSLVAGLPFNPGLEKGEDATAGTVGERVRAYFVPVGGRVDARLAAGGDLTSAGNADVSEGDTLKEVNEGALATHSVDTTSDPDGALYMALESVDNSGAAGGVENQTHIQVVRIA